MTKAKHLCQQSPHGDSIDLLWASPREVLNIYQAEESGCDIITATPELIAKFVRFHSASLERFSLDTVKMFVGMPSRPDTQSNDGHVFQNLPDGVQKSSGPHFVVGYRAVQKVCATSVSKAVDFLFWASADRRGTQVTQSMTSESFVILKPTRPLTMSESSQLDQR